MRIIFLLITFFVTEAFAMGILPKRIKNVDLKNPTSFEFNTSIEEVKRAINSILGKQYEELWTVYINDEGILKLGISFHESPYHIPKFKVDSDDEGEGDMNIRFFIDLKSANEVTKVTLRPEWYRIQIGEKGKWKAHGREPVRKDVPTSTYFEYSFLLKLGEILGEENMPPINTDPEKGEVIVK